MSYLGSVIGPRCDRAAISRFLTKAPKAIEYLSAHSELAFSTRSFSPDYHSEEPDATRSSRALDTVEFDGRLLGEDLALIRPPRPESLLFGGMAVNGADIAQLRATFRSVGSLGRTTRRLLAYAVRWLVHGRDTRLVLGQAMVGRALKSLRELDVSILMNAPAEQLIVEEGRVAGVLTGLSAVPTRILARRGVVIATGGFGRSRTMIAKWLPFPEQHLAVGADGTSGDGIALAESVGVTMCEDERRDSAYGVPVSLWKLADGSCRTFPHLISDRSKPGVIAVDQHGRRFVNEASSYHDFVRAMHDPARGAARNPAWLICDNAALEAYGLGHARPWPFPTRRLARDGYLISSPSLEELAARLAIAPTALRETIERHNAGAARGVDEEFGKGATIYNRYMGDPARQPNPCLAPIVTPPFHAVQIFAGNLGTSRGLQVDEHGRAVDRAGAPIPALYAVGNDANAVFHGAYPGPGASLGQALTGGYVAACHLAGDGFD